MTVAKLGANATGKLPDVDQEQRELENRPSTKFLRPRRPRAHNQTRKEPGKSMAPHRAAWSLTPNSSEIPGMALEYRRRVEVHRHLDPEDDGENVPLF